MAYSIILVVGAAQLRCGTMHLIALSSEPVGVLFVPSAGSRACISQGVSELAHDTGTKSDAVDLSSVVHVPHLI